ncbi:MAG: DUF4336 domain-containing protein, partial [Planctomycetota bacterium]
MLSEFAPNVFVHDGRKRFLGFMIPRCMTVVRFQDGRLWVHSPNTLTPELSAAIAELGEVTCIVAPNAMHAHAVDQYAAAYPEARVFGDPLLRVRHPRLRLDVALGNEPEPAFGGEIDHLVMRGNVFVQEVLFHHPGSRTLIVTDLIENLAPGDVSRWVRPVLRFCYGLLNGPAPSPEHQMYTLDPDATEASLAKAREWDFAR